MNKHLNLLIIIFLSFIILGSCATTYGVRGGKWEGDFKYIIKNAGGEKTSVLTDYRGDSNEIVIPSFMGGFPVTVIGNYAFKQKGLTKVTIPESVTIIEDHAFWRNKLGSVVIPHNVTTIGNFAFAYNGLTEILIPESVNTIGLGTFADNKLTSIVIPKGITEISSSVFINNQITNAVIPETVTSIGAEAFSNNKLTSIIIPDTVTAIGKSAFANNGLTSVEIPASITTIRQRVFSVNNLASVIIPAGIIAIESGAFKGNSLTSITIPDTVTSISDAFGELCFGNYSDEPGFEAEGAGFYEKHDDKWYHNGTELFKLTQLVCQSKKDINGTVTIVKIDGQNVRYSSNTAYIRGGLHTIEVSWKAEFVDMLAPPFNSNNPFSTPKKILQSDGTITFENESIASDSIYDLTAELDGIQVRFRITRRR